MGLDKLLSKVASISSLGATELSLLVLLECVLRIRKQLLSSESKLLLLALVEKLVRGPTPVMVAQGLRLAKIASSQFKEGQRVNVTQVMGDRLGELI